MPQFYLANYIGTGTRADPFRPALQDVGWSAIDLRPNGAVVAGKCLVALPTAAGSLPSGTINMGDGTAVSAAIRTQLSNALGVTVTKTTAATIAAELLIDLAGGARWKPLVPRQVGNMYRQEILLGGPLWSKEIPVIQGGASYSDDFNRADSSTIGGSWVEDLLDWSIASNKVTNSGADDSELRYNANLDTNDQYAQVVANLSGTRGCGVFVRHPASSTRTYYVANVFNTNSKELAKRVAGTYTALISPVTASYTFPGTIRVEVQGSTVRGLFNGVQYGQATDTSIPSNPQAGIFMYLAGSSATADDFLAADLTTPGESGSPVLPLPIPLQALQFDAPGPPTSLAQPVPPITLRVWAGGDDTAAGLSGSADVAETVTITSAGQAEGTATEAVTATLSAAGTGSGTASVAETVSITAAGTAAGTASRATTAGVTAAGSAAGTASVATSVTITATGALTGFVGSATVAETVTITAGGAGSGTASEAVTVGTTAAGTTAGSATRATTVSITASGALTGFVGGANVAESVSITASGAGASSASETVTSAVTATGAASGTASEPISVTITASGSLAGGSLSGTADVSEIVSIAATGRASGSGSAVVSVLITASGAIVGLEAPFGIGGVRAGPSMTGHTAAAPGIAGQGRAGAGITGQGGAGAGLAGQGNSGATVTGGRR